MNPDLNKLHVYPFERLAALLAGVRSPPGLRRIALSIGEPRHPPPALVDAALDAARGHLARYPSTRGEAWLREAIAAWLGRRFAPAALDPERQVLPVNGSREALFAFAQAVIRRDDRPLVVMPNPFYQIYEGAALLAGAEPYFLNAGPDDNYLGDWESVPEAVWQRCQLAYVCTPGNPGGQVLSGERLARLIELAERYDFVIASDECYSEIYYREPPPGLLQVCAERGRHDYRHCVVFNSLSKRSNLPGLRSGLVAGDAELIAAFLRYRTYHGSAMPGMTQAVSAAVWADEAHVADNRALYRAKLDAVLALLESAPGLRLERPEAGFFLWPMLACGGDDDAAFARALFAGQNVLTLPGSYLARDAAGVNPGRGHLRLALVAETGDCVEAARRITVFLQEKTRA